MYVHGVTDDDGETVSLRAAIGAKVRELRERSGRRQDDVAQEARDLGLAWNRARVGALERGDKAIPVEELVLLPLLLATEDGAPSLLDLLPSGDQWVTLGDATRVKADTIRAIVAGETFAVGGIEAMRSTTTREEAERGMEEMRRIVAVWPGGKLDDVVRAEDDARRDAEQVAGRKLGVPARVVSLAAWSRWGRGLTDERDARVAEKAPEDAAPRTVQALRGRVTRELYDELRDTLDAYRAGA